MKKVVLIVLVVIVALGLIFTFTGGVPQPLPPEEKPGDTSDVMEKVPAATGNIDDAVTATLSDALGDEPPAAESDESLISEDMQSLNNFGQSFDATQF